MRVLVCLLLLMILAVPSFVFAQVSDETVSRKNPDAPLGSERNPVRVSSGVMLGNAIRRDTPHYPQHCDKPCSGHLVMRAVIDSEGKVSRLEWILGGAEFREPVMDAVRRWVYNPYLLNDKAVWVETTISIIVDYGG